MAFENSHQTPIFLLKNPDCHLTILYFQFYMLQLFLPFLLLIALFLEPIQGQQITMKPVFIALPEIEESYDVVHAQLYKDDSKFAPQHAPNFYVQKALREKPNLPAQQINKQSTVSQPSQTIFQNPTIIDTTSKVEKSPKNHLQDSALDTNRGNLIQWMIQPIPLPPMFVVQNGMQIKLTQAPLKEASTVEYAEEGKIPNIQSSKQPISKKTDITSAIQQTQPKSTQAPSQQSIIPSPSNINKSTGETSFSSQIQKQRLAQHRKNLVLISGVVIVLLVVFVVARSQRNRKKQSMLQLHSRFQQYREEQQIEIFKDSEKDVSIKNGFSGRLSSDEYSDDEEQMVIHENTLIE